MEIPLSGNFVAGPPLGSYEFPVREKSGRKPKESPANAPGGIIRSPGDVGAWVQHARKMRGVTLVDAAALSGVGVRFLLELEHGKATASLGKVLHVLKRMGLELEIRPRGAR